MFPMRWSWSSLVQMWWCSQTGGWMWGSLLNEELKNSLVHPLRCSEPTPPSARPLRSPLPRSWLNLTRRCPWRTPPARRRSAGCRQGWRPRGSEGWRRGWRSQQSRGSGWQWGHRRGPRWPPSCRRGLLRSRPWGTWHSGGACGRRRSFLRQCRCPVGDQRWWTPLRSRSSPESFQSWEPGIGRVWRPQGPEEKRGGEGWERRARSKERKHVGREWRMRAGWMWLRKERGGENWGQWKSLVNNLWSRLRTTFPDFPPSSLFTLLPGESENQPINK